MRFDSEHEQVFSVRFRHVAKRSAVAVRGWPPGGV